MNYNYTNQINSIVSEVKKAVIGKDAIIIKVLLAILCKGHVLIEDIPGVGKTTLALAFSKALQAFRKASFSLRPANRTS